MSYSVIILCKRYFALLLVLCGLLLMFHSCSDEIGEEPVVPAEKEGLTLDISVPSPLVIEPAGGSRAVSEYLLLTDLNVLVANGTTDDAVITEGYYITSASPLTTDKVQGSIDGKPYIHFAKGTVSSSQKILLVGNMKKSLFSEVRNKTVAQVKVLQQNSTDGIPLGTIMFAEVDLSKGAETGHTVQPSHQGKTIEIALSRTVAMMTLVIDGRELNEGVTITPKQVRLCNVPKNCYIGKNNQWDELLKTPSSIGQHFSVLGDHKEAVLMGLMPIKGSDVDLSKKMTGKHFNNDYETATGIDPLFLFENIHAAGFGTEGIPASGKGKRPNGVADNPIAIQNAQETKISTYLEVEVFYEYEHPSEDMTISGPVMFRLFLGDNVTDNFDVKRDHYYKVTLRLKGLVVTEDGHKNNNGHLEINNQNLSWRIDTDLTDKVVISSGDVDLNASGDFFFVDIKGSKKVEWKITADIDASNQSLWVYGKVYGTTMWGTLNATEVTGTTIPEGGIMIFANPWDTDNGSWKDVFRQATVTLQYKNSSGQWVNANTIHIKQYAPIVVALPSDKNDFPPALQTFAGKSMFVDRVDRKAMPWGFYDYPFTKTSGDNSYQNMYDLVTDHKTFAEQNYSPWGWHKGSVAHNYEEGSAMIYALSLNLYDNNGSPAQLGSTPNDIINRTQFPTETDLRDRYENEFRYIWTIPSISGWQIIEKYAKDKINASGFPISSAKRYWTSNAVSSADVTFPDFKEGKKLSYFYRWNSGFDKYQETDVYPHAEQRNMPLLFRCIGLSKNAASN